MYGPRADMEMKMVNSFKMFLWWLYMPQSDKLFWCDSGIVQ